MSLNQPNEPIPHRILSITEDELSRIILDIHDGPVQYLFTALSLLTSIQNDVQQNSAQREAEPDELSLRDELSPRLAQVGTLLESSLYEIKHFMGTFRPPEFRRRSLTSIIEGLIIQHEESTSVRVEVEMQSVPDDITLPVKIALYRILQEALANTYRHAGVEQQWVRLWGEGEQICLEVEDDGRGFDPPNLMDPLEGELSAPVEHIGLRGMADRVALLGGTFELTSQINKGTRIMVRVPARV